MKFKVWLSLKGIKQNSIVIVTERFSLGGLRTVRKNYVFQKHVDSVISWSVFLSICWYDVYFTGKLYTPNYFANKHFLYK